MNFGVPKVTDFNRRNTKNWIKKEDFAFIVAIFLRLWANSFRPNSILAPVSPFNFSLLNLPSSLYLSKVDKKHLVGSCRQGNHAWIEEKGLYNYPISDEELIRYPYLMNVSELTIMYRKKADARYLVDSVEIISRQQLADLGYPVKSSRHKADTKYLLYHLGDRLEVNAPLDLNDFELILGKGVMLNIMTSGFHR